MHTYFGHIGTARDAIALIEACRLDLLPRVRSRLTANERREIRPGLVFVWDEGEAGMRRWTDGRSWTDGRTCGCFLTYLEMQGKRGRGLGRRFSLIAARSRGSKDTGAHMHNYSLKPGGLIKRTYSIATSTNHQLHLVCYSSSPDVELTSLPQPTTDPRLRYLVPPKDIYPTFYRPGPQDCIQQASQRILSRHCPPSETDGVLRCQDQTLGFKHQLQPHPPLLPGPPSAQERALDIVPVDQPIRNAPAHVKHANVQATQRCDATEQARCPHSVETTCIQLSNSRSLDNNNPATWSPQSSVMGIEDIFALIDAFYTPVETVFEMPLVVSV